MNIAVTSSVGVRRMAAEKAFRIELPDGERGRSPEDILRFDKLRAELASPRLALSKEQREERLRQISELETAPKIEAEKVWAQTATEESAALASARGEEVERGARGQVNIRSRDSLKNLLRGGKLTPEQYDAGLDVRDCYEARSLDVGSQLGNLSPNAEHNNDRYVALRLQRAKRLQRIGTIERAVAVECLAEPAALQMLRAICGERKSLSSFGEGRAFDRHLAALVGALNVADAIIRGK